MPRTEGITMLSCPGGSRHRQSDCPSLPASRQANNTQQTDAQILARLKDRAMPPSWAPTAGPADAPCRRTGARVTLRPLVSLLQPLHRSFPRCPPHNSSPPHEARAVWESTSFRNLDEVLFRQCLSRWRKRSAASSGFISALQAGGG